MSSISKIKEHPKFIELFKGKYPNSDFEQLDDKNINDMFESLYNETVNKKIDSENNTIKKTYELATSNILNIIIPVNLIYISGKINNIPIKILFDTGSSINFIFKSKIIEAGLENIVDKNSTTDICGINSKKETYGTIWYTEIKLDAILPKNKKTTDIFGLNFSVICDDDNTNQKSFDAIIGLTFMKSYETKIDFMTQTITLNRNIKIKFN
jgi:hypothetical protein